MRLAVCRARARTVGQWINGTPLPVLCSMNRYVAWIVEGVPSDHGGNGATDSRTHIIQPVHSATTFSIGHTPADRTTLLSFITKESR